MSTFLVTYLPRLLVLLIAIPVHEAAHAWAADRLGDPTGKYAGRMTLNPLAHFDLVGTVSMLFFGIGWAKPVPIDTRNFKNRKLGMALSAFAGPASNLLMSLLLMALGKLAYYTGGGAARTSLNIVAIVFLYMSSINITLAVFNMLPVPPFDGSRIFLLVLPEKYYFQIMKYERYIMLGICLLLFLGVLSIPLNAAVSSISSLFDTMTSFIDRLFTIAPQASGIIGVV